MRDELQFIQALVQYYVQLYMHTACYMHKLVEEKDRETKYVDIRRSEPGFGRAHESHHLVIFF